MKVLYIAPGNDIHAIRWINRMVEEGVECVLLNSIPSLELLPCKAGIINLPDPFFNSDSRLSTSPVKSFRRYLFFRRSIKKIIEKESPDVVHIHWLFDLPQLATARVSTVPIISTPYGSDLLLFKNRRLNNLHKYALNQYVTRIIVKNSAYFCCDAAHLKDRLVELGANEKNIEIIYFGTDIQEFSPGLKSANYKNRLGIPEENLIVLSNRGLSEVYDVKTFVLAAKEALLTDKNLTFLVAGGGPLLTQLQQLVEDLGVSKKVCFLGRLSDEDFALTTGNADVYVSTSTSDGGLAASVAEAMACEIPVLITEFGDNSKWLDDESAGFSFPIGDHKQLADQILKLASDSELRARMGRKGREIIEVRNNSRKEITKIRNLYVRAIKHQ
jgi:glycosyltransferase involved in cell wall biosynthesis